MRIVTNTRLAERNRKFATYIFIFTFILLIGGFILLNYPLFSGEPATTPILILQLLTLPLAFVLTLVSVRMTNLWARPPRPDRAIGEAMKGMSKKSVLYNYYHIPARHVLFSPQGIFVITTRWHDSKFSVDNDQWRTHANPISRFFNTIRMDGIGNPHRDAKKQAMVVQNTLKKIVDEDIVVEPLIVFVDANVDIEIGETSIPILFASTKRKPNLNDYLRQRNRDLDANERGMMPLTDEQIEAFETLTMGMVTTEDDV